MVAAEKPDVQQDRLRHELRNQIGIALANIEGMIDGLVPPTPSRLEAVANALHEAGKLLEQADEKTS